MLHRGSTSKAGVRGMLMRGVDQLESACQSCVYGSVQQSVCRCCLRHMPNKDTGKDIDPKTVRAR